MDQDRLDGIAHQVKGSIKEAAGTVAGDAKLKAEGAAEKLGGKLQNAAGGVKDVVREQEDRDGDGI